MSPIATLATRLFVGRHASGGGRIDLLAVAAFAIGTALLQVVLGGFHLFLQRMDAPPPALAEIIAASGSAGKGAAGNWVMLAALASVLLVVPLVSLAASAARMGALGRDRRLATLRLLGATPAEVVRLTAAETALQAAAGAVLGTVLYLVTLPAWAPLTFQATPVGPTGLLLPAGWILGVILGVVVLAAASAALGLRQVRISPLGVARESGRPKLGLRRVAVFVALLIAWNVIGSQLNQLKDVAAMASVVAVGLALFMGVINLIGPLVLQFFARMLVHSGGLRGRLAGRRLLDDPRGAWRAVSGLAFVGFVAGSLLALPTAPDGTPLPAIERLLQQDMVTGAYLTLAISFAIAAAATSLNQVAAVLDRRRVLVHLDHAGAPRGLFHAVRRTEVLLPTVLASVGSAGLATAFFAPLGLVSGAGDGTPLVQLAGTLVAGLVLVWAASEACRPTLTATLANAGPRVD